MYLYYIICTGIQSNLYLVLNFRSVWRNSNYLISKLFLLFLSDWRYRRNTVYLNSQANHTFYWYYSWDLFIFDETLFFLHIPEVESSCIGGSENKTALHPDTCRFPGQHDGGQTACTRLVKHQQGTVGAPNSCHTPGIVIMITYVHRGMNRGKTKHSVLHIIRTLELFLVESISVCTVWKSKC